MSFDYAFILITLPAFLKAVGVTLQVGLIAIGTSLLVALLNATILVFRRPYLRKLVGLYVELARNTPLLIQLCFVCFALPAVVIKVSGSTAAIITMTFPGGVYLTEVYVRKELSDDTRPESVVVEGGQVAGMIVCWIDGDACPSPQPSPSGEGADLCAFQT